MNNDYGKINTRLLPLTSDLVFKAVYGRNTNASNAALIALLNRLLGKEKDPIVWLHCENPFSYQTYQGEKEIVMDVKVQLSSGQLLDLEMQVDHLESYINRSIYYMGKLVNESLESGEDYDKMKETIVISIVNRTLFPQYEKAFSTYFLKENDENHKLSEITRIHFLELGKIHLNKEISEMTPHERLGAYFKYAADDSKSEFLDQLLEYESEVIALTKPIHEEISAEKEMRELEEARKRYRMDVNTARSVGHREGREEGRTEGEIIRLTKQISKKLSKGISLETIAVELEEDISFIEPIYIVAQMFAPEYDPEEIYDAYMKQ